MPRERRDTYERINKGFIGANNIESNSRLCMSSAASGYKLSLGSDGPPGSYQDFDKAHLFFVIGANMADCHPILFLRMMDRVKAGAKLIVVDPRRNATAEKADLFLRVRPQDGDHRPRSLPTGDHAGRLPRDRDQCLRRHHPAGRPLGRGREGDDQLRTEHDADAQGGGTARGGVAGLADHRPGRPRDGLRARIRLRVGRRGVRGDSPVLEPEDRLRRPRRQPREAGGDPSSMANRPGGRERPQSDPPPQRRRQPVPRVEEDRRRPEIAFVTERGKAFFLPRPHMAPAEMPDADFPFVLNTGRLQHQWHTLTKTGKVATLNKLNPGPFVELHPDDARALGVADKDRGEIRSRRGRAVSPAAVTDRVRPGNCFAPFHWSDVFGDDLAINAVTSDAVDPVSLQPEFKFSAVALTRVGGPVEVVPADADEPAVSSTAPAREFAAVAARSEAVVTERGAVATLEFAPVVRTLATPSAAVEVFAQLVDVLRDAPIRVDAQALASALKPLQPRLYSISSSPTERPDEVQLTVSTVRFDSGWGRRKGACSTFLADRAVDAVLPIFVQRSSHFHPPDDPAAPMIMVGSGTGVAPFRAFLQERRATGAAGDNWLFFGEQHAASDFYYRDEIAGWRCDGRLSRLDLAFSRDDEEKIYVQHRMLERGAELWRWLDRGAHFYVCGDAERMAKDVDIVLRMVVARHGGLGEADADAYVNRMSQEKRYVRDVY